MPAPASIGRGPETSRAISPTPHGTEETDINCYRDLRFLKKAGKGARLLRMGSTAVLQGGLSQWIQYGDAAMRIKQYKTEVGHMSIWGGIWIYGAGNGACASLQLAGMAQILRGKA